MAGGTEAERERLRGLPLEPSACRLLYGDGFLLRLPAGESSPGMLRLRIGPRADTLLEALLACIEEFG